MKTGQRSGHEKGQDKGQHRTGQQGIGPDGAAQARTRKDTREQDRTTQGKSGDGLVDRSQWTNEGGQDKEGRSLSAQVGCAGWARGCGEGAAGVQGERQPEGRL